MDFRREDEENKMNHPENQDNEMNQQKDTHQENEKQIDAPEKEKELVFHQHENEASASQESVTKHSPQMVDDRASKKEKKRKAAWLSPILGGLLAGVLYLALHRFCRSHRIQLPTRKRRLHQASRQPQIISRQNKSPMPQMWLIW